MDRDHQPADRAVPRSRASWRHALPNAISLVRIAGSAAPIIAAIMGSPSLFWSWLVVAAVSDTVDGVLARRWDAVTDRGRQLDSWGDLLSLVGGLVGAAVLWPAHWDRQHAWLTALILAHLVPAAFGLLRHGGLLGYHSRLARLSSYAVWPGGALMIAGVTPTIFHVAVALELLVAIEYLTIWHICPTHRGEISSIARALRLRQAGR